MGTGLGAAAGRLEGSLLDSPRAAGKEGVPQGDFQWVGWGQYTSSWSLLHTFRAAAPPAPQFSLCSEKAALISLSLSQSGAAPPPQARPQQASSSLLLLASFDSLPRETFLKQDGASGLLSPEPESALVRCAGPQQEGAATAGQACYPEAAPRRGPLQCADPK